MWLKTGRVNSRTEYIEELRRLAEHSNYRTILQDMQWEQLICGLEHEHIQQPLLSEGDTLTLEKEVGIAQAMESAIKQ